MITMFIILVMINKVKKVLEVKRVVSVGMWLEVLEMVFGMVEISVPPFRERGKPPTRCS